MENKRNPKKMNFEILETRRLLLKGLSPADMKYLFEQVPKAELMTILGHRSEEDYEKEEYKYRNGYASYNRNFLLFLMIDKASGTIVGRCGLHNWNAEHQRAEIGYNMVDESFKRQGLMSEAVEAIIDYGFNQMNLHRIEALVGRHNIPSLRIIQKNKFVQEGVLREHFFIGGKHEDSILFSRLRAEYFGEDAG
jgi:[ribosomal protein S5]-alanine N-acetyltransferase